MEATRSHFLTALVRTWAPVFLSLICVTEVGAAPPDTGTRLHRAELEHFTLWSQRELSKSDIYETRQNLQNVRRDVGRAFGGFFPKPKFDVVLTQEDVFHAYSRSAAHVTGLFDGSIHLPVKDQGAPERLKAILYHEYTHALLWLVSEGKCPPWIQEGFAVDREESVDPRRILNAATLVKDGRLLWSLDDLDAHMIPDANDPHSNELAYQEAFAVIRYLKSRQTPAVLLRWIRQIARSASWESAASETLGMNRKKIELETVKYLTDSKGDDGIVS